MNAKQLASTAMRTFRTGMISATVFQLAIGSAFAAPLSNSQPSQYARHCRHVAFPQCGSGGDDCAGRRPAAPSD